MRETLTNAGLTTERLTLRPLTQADAERISALAGDFEVARMVTSIPHPNPVVAAEGWLLMLEGRAPLGLDQVFGVEVEGEGLVGCVGGHARAEGATPELGYWIGRPYWGRGFATEAARALVEHLFSLGHARVQSGHFLDNPASGRVLEKLGFLPTGETQARFSLARGAKALCRMMRREAAEAAPRVAAGA